jgi:hypothetical protein
MYLQEKHNYREEKLLEIKPIMKSQFKQLQKTGMEAEQYFLTNYRCSEIFKDGEIEDARFLGDGYDFQVEAKGIYYLAEIKGVRSNKGAIRLTNNEYEKALEYKDRYILSVISNLNEVPKMTNILNPTQNLILNKNIIEQKQITFSTNIIDW